MNYINKTTITFAVLIISVLTGIISYYWLGPDNKIEQECEKIIKDETGIDIDLSPNEQSSSSTSSTSSSTSSP